VTLLALDYDGTIAEQDQLAAVVTLYTTLEGGWKLSDAEWMNLIRPR